MQPISFSHKHHAGLYRIDCQYFHSGTDRSPAAGVPSPHEEERLKGYCTRRLEKIFERNRWPIVETPGEDVLRARLIVEDVKLERWRRSRCGNIISNSSVDGIAIVLELRGWGKERPTIVS